MDNTMMRGADFIIKALEDAGVHVVFGYPGGAIMPVYDAILDSSIEHILCRHEQGAALAADGFARASGQVGVCIATSGPGATNLITGIANAYLDSIPMVIITGQVAAPLIGTDAFQEVDVLGLTMPIIKHSYLVESVESLPEIFAEAFHLAQEGRPGPVLIDVPKNIQVQEFVPKKAPHIVVEDECSRFDISALAQCLKQAKKPVIYHGGGVQISRAEALLKDFAEKAKIPCVHTLRGVGNLPTEHPNNIGMIGMHGLKAANYTIQHADLLIVLGARFDDRATGKLDEFAPHAKVIHVDTDACELNKLRDSIIPIRSDLKSLLTILLQNFSSIQWGAWLEECQKLRDENQWDYNYPGDDIYAPDFLNKLSLRAHSDTIIACDVGQHQMWVAQHCHFSKPQHHLSSGGLGTMGYGLPAAIGAHYSHPNSTVINVSGDGSFMMNVQELATIKRYNLPIKIVVIDNQSLGMVRQWQELFFAERYSEIDLSDNPDFTEVARCFGIETQRITQKSEVDSGIKALLQDNTPFLLHVCIDPQSNVWPLVPPGANNKQMMMKEANS